MKTLAQYLNEATEMVTKVPNLVVTYKAEIPNLTVKVPNNYSEDDLQIYLDDLFLDKLPGSTEDSKKLLGDNIDELNDAYFEYDKYEASDKEPDVLNVDWDPKYGDNKDVDTYSYYTLKNLKYKLQFSEFNLNNTDDGTITEQLIDIFKTLESNETNKYPLNIKLDKVEYDQ